MEPTIELADELFRDKVRQARRTSPEERLLDGARLFDHACRVMMDGIRNRYPDASQEEVTRLLFHRMEIGRGLEEGQ